MSSVHIGILHQLKSYIMYSENDTKYMCLWLNSYDRCAARNQYQSAAAQDIQISITELCFPYIRDVMTWHNFGIYSLVGHSDLNLEITGKEKEDADKLRLEIIEQLIERFE